MILDIPKALLKDFKNRWKNSEQQNIQREHLDEIIFTSDGYTLNSNFKPSKNKLLEEIRSFHPFKITLTKEALLPVQSGANDIRLELHMLNTSILADLYTKSYARQLYALYNPTFEPVTLTFPELRFLWNYVRAYVSILFANEGTDFTLDSISKQFLEGLSTMPLAKPNKIFRFTPPNIINNYQTWYDSSLYGTRWQDYADESGVVDFYDDPDDFDEDDDLDDLDDTDIIH